MLPPMLWKSLLAAIAVAALLTPVAALPDLDALDLYASRTRDTFILAPSKICGVGGLPADLPVGTLFSADFEAAVPGFALTGQSTNFWHVTGFPGQGLDAGHSGTQRLYYGVERPQGGSFNFGRTLGAITFTQPLAIPVVGETLITWAEKWEVEWGAFGVYDAMGIQLVSSPTAPYQTAGGPASGPINPATLCLSDPIDPVTQTQDAGSGIPSCSPNIATPCATPPGWMLRTEYVPDQFKGQTVYLRYNFDAMDSLYNDFLGWMVDDVRVVTVGV